MCKIKYYFFLEKTIHDILWTSVIFYECLLPSNPKSMHLDDTKKNSTPEIKKEYKKSNLEVLTNENDYLVKNLKKAG